MREQRFDFSDDERTKKVVRLGEKILELLKSEFSTPGEAIAALRLIYEGIERKHRVRSELSPHKEQKHV